MSNENNTTERLSMRKSVLIWVGGICLGWGIASGLIFTYWALSRQDPIEDIEGVNASMTASVDDTSKGLNEVMPAAGPAQSTKATKTE